MLKKLIIFYIYDIISKEGDRIMVRNERGSILKAVVIAGIVVSIFIVILLVEG